MFMKDVVNLQKQEETQRIFVCDLEIFYWLELADGTILVDFKYLGEMQKQCGD